jgi:NIMA-interacting peptidyl-prolyl cis-trans isomerase 1
VTSPSEPALEKGPSSSSKSGIPDWVPWVVMIGFMFLGSAGALGFVRSPFGSHSQQTERAEGKTETAPAAVASVAAPVADTAFQPPPPDNGIRPPGVPEEIVVRQILVQHKSSWKRAPQVTRTKEEARRRCAEALAKLDHGADWDKVMEEYSDNADTKKNGGSMGLIKWEGASWLIKGPVFKLKLGERSPVTASPFGYHVYQRTK